MAGMGGPLLSWVPIWAYYGERPLTTTLLSCTVVWYLSVISLTRHLHLLTGWDPSGHLIVYGSQLVPLLQMWKRGDVGGDVVGTPCTVILLWLLMWAAVLWYLSGMTSMAFHTLSETAAAALMVLGLAVWIDTAERWQPGHAGVDGWQVVSAALLWVVPTGLSWLAAQDSAHPLLFGMLMYDMGVWLSLSLLLGRRQHEL